MATRKKQGTRKGRTPETGPSVEPLVPPEGAAAPSVRQKCLLAAAIVVEASWVAALVAMALAE